MFELIGHEDNAQCVLCEKERECVQVVCKSGTLDGMVCAKCLYRQAKVRKRKAPHREAGNGIPTATPAHHG